MNSEEVHITANPTPNPQALKFIVDRQMVEGEPVFYNNLKEATGSPLAEKLFAMDGVKQLFAFQNFVTVTKEDDTSWQDFARAVGKVIRGHVQSGETPHFLPAKAAETVSDDGKVAIIMDVLEEIRPMVAMDGGNIVFAGYNGGILQLHMQGSCAGCPSSTMTLKAGIERRLREVLPELVEVVAV